MKTKYDLVTDGLLAELAKEEKSIIEAGSALDRIQVGFEVASQKYAAVRDMVTKRLGYSPYSENFLGWPEDAIPTIVKLSGNLGKYRFVHLKIGEAVAAALKEASKPLTLEEIVEKSHGGGRPGITPRMVNAALMKTTRIEKTKDGKYIYKEEIPF